MYQLVNAKNVGCMKIIQNNLCIFVKGVTTRLKPAKIQMLTCVIPACEVSQGITRCHKLTD